MANDRVNDDALRHQHAASIAALALPKLLAFLASVGNHIGATHRQALADLLNGLARQLTRATVGRFGYPLTCGAGKTQGLVAVLAAAHELGLPYSVVVAAQKVTDLAKIRRDLRLAGVPAEMAGLIHSKSAGSVRNELADATPAVLLEDCTSTGTDDRQFLLATHEMLRRGGRDGLAFEHRGQPRDLVVWDETLLMSEVGAVSVKKVERAANGWLEGGQQFAHDFLRAVANRAGDEMRRQVQHRARPEQFVIECEPELEARLRELVGATRWSDEYASADAKYLGAVLDLVGCNVAVAVPGRGSDDALIHHEVVIDADNIAVLDASHVVKLLGQLGVRDAGSAAMRACKRYDDCEATATPIAASKDAQKDRAVVRKLATLTALILAAFPADESAVIFTFKDRRAAFETALRAAGVDLDAKINGRPRIAVATWGTEAGTNQHAHCSHVLMVGVLRQERSRLMAQWSGELADLTDHPDMGKLREVELSEMASCVLQALSRGRSRVSVIGPDGESRALKQSIHIIDSDAERIADLLQSSGCLPGMRWATGDTGKATTDLTAQAARAISSALAALPVDREVVSTRELKALAGQAGAPTTSDKSFTKAIESACRASVLAGGVAWKREGRGVRRLPRSGIEALDLVGVTAARPQLNGTVPKERSSLGGVPLTSNCAQLAQLTQEAA